MRRPCASSQLLVSSLKMASFDGNHVGFDARLLRRVGDEPEVVVVLVVLINFGGYVCQVQYGLHARGDFGGEDVAPTVGEASPISPQWT